MRASSCARTTACRARSVKRSNTTCRLRRRGLPPPVQPMDPDAAAGGPRVDGPRRSCALEERRLERPTRLGQERLAAEPRQQDEELLHVAPLVEEIRAEDEIPRRGF